MIGCIVVGGLVALGIGKIIAGHSRHGWCCRGSLRARFGGGPGGWSCAGGPGGATEEWGIDDDGGVGWGRGGGDHPDHHAWFGHRWGGRHSFGWGRRPGFIMGAVLSRLETTPTQNQALRAAAKEFRASASAARGEGRRTRADLAAALRRSAVDAESLGEMFARHDSALEDVRKAFVGMIIKVHDVLDETQRERLAQLMELGPRWFRSAMPGMSVERW